MLSRFVIAFLPRSKCLLIFTAAVIVRSALGTQEDKIRLCEVTIYIVSVYIYQYILSVAGNQACVRT